MGKEILTKTDEYDRAKRSVEVNQQQLSVVEDRIRSLEAELHEALVKQETRGYATATIERLKNEIKKLQDEQTDLQLSISAIQKALPELKKEADIETVKTETKELRQVADSCVEAIKQVQVADFLVKSQELLVQFDNASNAYAHFKQKWGSLFEIAGRLNMERELSSLKEIEATVTVERSKLIDASREVIDKAKHDFELKLLLFGHI